MNIALITEHFPPSTSGIARSVYRIARNLARSQRVFVIVLEYQKEGHVKPYSKKERRITKLGHEFSVYKLGPNSRCALRPGMVASQKRNSVMLIEEICKKEKIQLLHAFRILDPGFLGAVAAKKLGIPIIVSVRGNDLSRDMYDTAKFSLISWVLKTAKAVTFVTRRLQLLGQQFFDLPTSLTIENSVDIGEILKKSANKKILMKFQIRTTSRVIGYVGEIREKKGLMYLLEAFSILVRHYKDLHLLLIGDFTKNWEKKFYVEYIERMALKECVTITGNVPHSEAMRHLKNMDIFVMPSIDDGMPNAMLEAFALGVPTVVTDVFSSDLQNNKHSCIVRKGDSTALKEAISRLLDHPSYAESLAKNARRLIKNRYSIENETRAYLGLYREVISNAQEKR